MKTYTLSFGQTIGHTPVNPERTAKRSAHGVNGDVIYQEWTNRKAMARSIRMQEKREPSNQDWRACAPLTDVEGY